jgi:ubiquitin-conjugating enzyme (huntingtin interacting protein 2)
MKGAICLDTLSSAWSPVLTIKSALLSLQSLLSTPEPKDPQDAEVARMLMHNPREFDRVAREWSVRYAGAPKIEMCEGSGGATTASLKQVRKKSKEEEEREQMAAYVFPPCFVSAPHGQLDPSLLAQTFTKESHSDPRFNRYEGYNKDLIDRFVNMGFDVDRVVAAFKFVGIDKNDGEDYELEEAYMGDITARLLGEP